MFTRNLLLSKHCLMTVDHHSSRYRFSTTTSSRMIQRFRGRNSNSVSFSCYSALSYPQWLSRYNKYNYNNTTTSSSSKNNYHYYIASRLYTTALMRGVPNTLSSAISMSSPVEPISLGKAIEQHMAYSGVFKSTIPRLIEIDADDAYPDCVFIEDTAIVIDDKAVITRIGAQSRQGEVDATKEVLSSLGLQIFDMRSTALSSSLLDELAAATEITCDGGDVLYPVTYYRDGDSCHLPWQKRGGHHLFVGISKRTNIEGLKYLEKVFSDVEIIPVDLLSGSFQQQQQEDHGGGVLHLKSIVTHLDHETLLIPTGAIGDDVCVQMEADKRGYKVVRLPDVAACNVVSIHGKIVLAQPCISKESKEILYREVVEKRGMALHFIDASEFSKCDGALTCKSILIP